MKKNFDVEKLLKVLGVLNLVIAIIVLIFLIATYCRMDQAFAEEETFIPLTTEEIMHHESEVAIERMKTHPVETIEEETKYLIEVTEEDIALMARVVMSEGSILSTDGKQAIATTIVNRVRDNEFEFCNQNTVEEVIYHQNAYSTADNGEPNEECYEAVYNALTYEGFPPTMFYFRSGHYHDFGTAYAIFGNTYFSTR